jgi:uncharacterized short protein YbdD (DUF466 family)
MLKKLKKAWRFLEQTGNLMVGIPDYEVYVEHMKTHHPDKHCMTHEEFFRNRQEARYKHGGSGGRCC